ncbi:pyridoxal phosphate-dependent aminotransferase [Azospirillum sp. ST 5-10]|uniref:pyridoxal phosphate-dependent aminotransferase n=1 Tax=unclassified Azospirillum TaxID=2630922 RepID=UPI003F4A2DA1
MSRLSPRVAALRPSPTAAISDKVRRLAAEGRSIINLGEGELDFDTPEHVKEAAIAAIRAGDTKYTAVSGTPDLKAAIIDKFERENGLTYGMDEVIAGVGAKPLILNALLATLAPGDEVVLPAPYWVSYPDMIALADGTARVVPCREEDGFRLRPEDLEAAITPRTRWVILNSPGNPSGAVLSPAEMKALTDVLMRHPHVLVMADDIYEHIVLDGAFATPAAVEPALASRTLTINGVSKAYSMTGWRLGFAGGPAWLVRALQTLQSQSTTNPTSISQAAAVAALRGGTGFLRDRLAVLRQRRDLVLDAVAAAPGLSCAVPAGAFYVYANCAGLIGRRRPDGPAIASDLDVADYLLSQAGVGLVHGAAFGLSPYIRIAYAVDTGVLRDACERIRAACAALH